MDRFWLLTWTTYGTWLPGENYGFVSAVRNEQGEQVIHNMPNTPFEEGMPGLKEYARQVMKGDPVWLIGEQARALLEQFHETAQYRNWQLLAVAIMANHIHIVIGVPGDPEPEKLLQSLKAYGSRKLNKAWDRPASDTWWTESGSRRKLPNESAVRAAIVYVREQEKPLLIWIADGY